MCHAMFIQVDEFYHAEPIADEIDAASFGVASEAGENIGTVAPDLARVSADNRDSIATAA